MTTPTMIDVLKNIVKKTPLMRWKREIDIRKDEIERFLSEAESILKIGGGESVDNKVITKEYQRDLRKYMFNFNEWYSMYGLYGASEDVKRSYISRSEAQKCYRLLIDKSVRNLFHNKSLFVKTFSDGIHREILEVTPHTTVNEVKRVVFGRDVIVKPIDGSLGMGVYKITADRTDSLDYEQLLEDCVKGHCLIEECIHGDDSLQRFHPSSLNTIRVMTSFDGENCRMFASFVRFGRGGAVIDNAHGGGVYATVDVNDGVICSDAQDVEGNIYVNHPDTGLTFKGTQIPKWEEICGLCTKSHSKVDTPFVGWDVCINRKGEIEFIEGNHAPDVDVIQGPTKTGYKKAFMGVCRSYKSRRK